MHAELDSLPNRDIITFHEAFPYFAEEFNLNIVGVIEIEPDSEPSAKEIENIIATVKANNIKALFTEPQYSSQVAQTIANETGATVYELDPIVTGDANSDAYDDYINKMQKNLDVLKEAVKMIKKANFNKNNSCNNFCCTKIDNFSVTIGNNEILKDVNLHIHCGELTSIIGPNGAGKSTLLKALLGEVKHTGNLTFTGQNDNTYHQPIIGYIPQYLTFDKNTPISVLDLFVCCKTTKPSWIKPKKSCVKKY